MPRHTHKAFLLTFIYSIYNYANIYLIRTCLQRYNLCTCHLMLQQFLSISKGWKSQEGQLEKEHEDVQEKQGNSTAINWKDQDREDIS